MQRYIVVVLTLVLANAAAGRLLRQVEQQATEIAMRPVQIGDGNQRILSRQYISTHGGAVRALGRPVLAELRRRARFPGTATDLARQLETDDELHIDAVNKALMFICTDLAAETVGTAALGAPSQPDATIPPAQAFTLSSRPSAQKKIYLDFDGHNTTGSDWNAATGRPVIETPAYDSDGNTNSFSTNELNDVIAVWRAVSEDYAMFDVDVTTVEPTEALAAGQAVRVVIGGTYSDWFGTPAGGVAYVGRFTATNLPAFVFSVSLSNLAQHVWEAVSHEVGHTLGLSHDKTASSAYYSGSGNWAPIMGSAYNKALTTFDKGEYLGALNTEDDLAVIARIVPVITQTTSGTNISTAVQLNGTIDPATGAATARVHGVVTSASGNWCAFNAVAGTATLSVSVLAPATIAGVSHSRSNLDAQLDVYNAAGTLLQTINPPGVDAVDGLGVAPVRISLPSNGTYYIKVSGVAAGDYSSYGLRGQFELTAVYTPCADCNVTALVPRTDAPPSPSPTPSPSPSPSPAAATPLRVTSITLAKLWGNTARSQVYCTTTVTVRDLAGNPLSGVRVNGQWRMAPNGGTVSTANTAFMLSSSAGTVSFRSANVAATGGSCTFTVLDATRSGYLLDTAGSMLTRTITL